MTYPVDPMAIHETDKGLWDSDRNLYLTFQEEEAYRKMSTAKVHDPVNHPNHYTSHPSGVEVIEITEHMNFCLGNAVKYILRAEHKGKQIEDLRKAAWYVNREIDRLLIEQQRKETYHAIAAPPHV